MVISPPTATDRSQNGHGHTPRLNTDYFPSSSSSALTTLAAAAAAAATTTTTTVTTGNALGIIYDSVTAPAVNGKNNHSLSNTSNLNHHNKRLRTGSISGRLRTASDLEEAGLIDKYQKGIVKDMIIGQDPGILNVLDKFNTSGDTNELKNDLLLSLARRPSIDVDLLEGLDFEFLNSFSTNIEYEGERSMSQVFDEDDDEPFDAFFHSSVLATLSAANATTVAAAAASTYTGGSVVYPHPAALSHGGPAAASLLTVPSFAPSSSSSSSSSSSRPPLPPLPNMHQAAPSSLQQQHRNQRGSSLGSLGDLDLPESPGDRVELSAYEALARSLQLREKTHYPSSVSSSSDRPRRRSSTLSHGDNDLAAVDVACIDSMEMDEFFEFLQGSGEEHQHQEFLLADIALASHDLMGTAAPGIEPTSPRGKPKKKSAKAKAEGLTSPHVKVKIEPAATPTSEADSSGRTSRSKVRAAAGLGPASKLSSASPGPGSVELAAVNNSGSQSRGQAAAGAAGAGSLSRATTAPAGMAANPASTFAAALHPSSTSSSGSAVLRPSGPIASSLSSSLLSHHASQQHHHHHPGLAGSMGGSSSSSQLTARLSSHGSPAALLAHHPGNKSVRPVLLLPSTQNHLQNQLQHSSGVPTAVLPSSLVGTGAPGQGASGSLEGYVGAYSAEQRRLRVQRFVAARTKRVWTKKVKYDVRKNFADSRIRVKGRFVKKEDEESLRDPPPSMMSVSGMPLGMGQGHSFLQSQGQMQMQMAGQSQSGLSMTYSLPSISMTGFSSSMPLHHISSAHSIASLQQHHPHHPHPQQHAHLIQSGAAASSGLSHHAYPTYASSGLGNSNSNSNSAGSSNSNISSSIISCSSSAIAAAAGGGVAGVAGGGGLVAAAAPAAVSKGPEPQSQSQPQPPLAP